MKNKFILLLAFLCIFNIPLCFTVKAEGNSQVQPIVQQIVPINTITLDESVKTLEVGKTITINALISPDNATNKELVWSSSNVKVLAVDNKGSVTALEQGTARITVKTITGDKEVGCYITVVLGHKGWILENHKWYYYENNIKKVGWLSYNESWYYLNINGEMKIGWQQDKGKWYYLSPSGVMLAGWKQDGSNWYYLSATGEMVTGWKQDGSNWYYLSPSGAMLTGWKQDDSNWYYLSASGVMLTGWKQDGSNWYYLNPSGEMKSGWLLYNGTWYYLYSNGEMAINPGNLSSRTTNFVMIDLKNQSVNIFSGYANHWKFIRTMKCATGAEDTPTLKGLFAIQGRGLMFRAASNTICRYYTGFNGNYLFHTVLLDNNGNIQDPTLGSPVSHGCVRLTIEDAKYIYYNIPYNTTVWSN